ncbi:hypothetical protein [Paenisporosarcina antarctica]|uniref:hypothetical protein n=1 Tax=Paenisporosarcina antarctica TaxID=417367 RepID=UPI0014171008|nr:hypothetical protein [Paenisporosarcina antarctica]
MYHYWKNHREDIVSIRDNEGKEVDSYKYDAYLLLLTGVRELAQANSIRYQETKNYYL